jgi:hypothetical protein
MSTVGDSGSVYGDSSIYGGSQAPNGGRAFEFIGVGDYFTDYRGQADNRSVADSIDSRRF